MTLFRIALLLVALIFAPGWSAWAQSDPLQEANQLFRQGQLDRAMDRVNGYLATRPKDPKGRFLKGLILTEQNKPNEAIRIFTDLSQDYPDLPEPYNNLAVLYASQGQYEKARASLEMAIRTHPSYATAHENLGDIYAKMASQAYDKALQLDRSNQAAQGKLNLIKDLFSQTTAKGGQPSKVAAAKPEPPAAQPSAPAAQPAAPAAKPPAPAVKAPATTVAEAPVAKPVTPTPAPQPKALPADNTGDVIRAVNGWVRAWETNDVPGYLAFYADDFQTPKGMTRKAWEAERKARIAKPRKIEVEIDTPKVRFDEKNKALVTFRQHYKSGPLDVKGMKTLVMVKNGDKWLIQQERSGA
jgi:tetratricopeptide (TPR) repeat protein